MVLSSRTQRAVLFLFALAFSPRVAEAHPLGMSSVNRYAGVRLHARELEVDWLVDYAELPAWTEIEALDTDHDGAVTPAERDTYVRALVPRMRSTLHVDVDGSPVALREVFHAIEAPPGQNGLSTLRVAIEFRGALPPTAPRCAVHLRDTFLEGRGGWRELAAESTPAGRLVSSNLPAGPRAGAGLAYPTDPSDPNTLRVSPPRIDDARFVFERAEADTPATAWLRRAVTRSTGTDGERLVALLRDPQRSWGFVLFALALAFALGAGHALSPGHGKTLVGAWLVGSKGRPRDALILGASVTVSHTASVFAMGLLALVVERYVGSDKLLRALELSSGALVAGLALSQLPERIRRARGLAPVDHAHAHAHDHDHDHAHNHAHDHGPDGHTHAPPETLSLRGLIALGVSGGMVPCPGALVVLLAAIGMHRIGFGLALLVAFSMGLAAVLTGIGLAFVLARARFERISTDGRIFRVLPVLSSLAVLTLGAVIVVKALMG